MFGRGRVGRPFRINLSSSYPRYLAPLRLGLCVVAAGLLWGIVWNVQQIPELRATRAKLRASVARIAELDRQFMATVQQDGTPLTDTVIQQLPQDIAFVNQVTAKRAFSWTTLLTELEQTVPPGLAISGIQHDLKDVLTIHLSGNAMTIDAVTEFILALANHSAFYDPLLVKHNVKSQDGLVEFTLQVGYRGLKT